MLALQSVCQWLLNHTPESLQALRFICTHSFAACQQVLHFQPWKYIQKNWVSQCYFPHILLAAAHAFLAKNLAFHCYLLYSWSRVFSGFIYDFLSENPCISFVFNILKFSNSGFFQSSAAWLMTNTPELHFLHYPGWFVCVEPLISAFPFSPFDSVTSLIPF